MWFDLFKSKTPFHRQNVSGNEANFTQEEEIAENKKVRKGYLFCVTESVIFFRKNKTRQTLLYINICVPFFLLFFVNYFPVFKQIIYLWNKKKCEKQVQTNWERHSLTYSKVTSSQSKAERNLKERERDRRKQLSINRKRDFYPPNSIARVLVLFSKKKNKNTEKKKKTHPNKQAS